MCVSTRCTLFAGCAAWVCFHWKVYGEIEQNCEVYTYLTEWKNSTVLRYSGGLFLYIENYKEKLYCSSTSINYLLCTFYYIENCWKWIYWAGLKGGCWYCIYLSLVELNLLTPQFSRQFIFTHLAIILFTIWLYILYTSVLSCNE